MREYPPILQISSCLCGNKIKKRSFALDFFFSNKHAEPTQASSLRAFTDWEKITKAQRTGFHPYLPVKSSEDLLQMSQCPGHMADPSETISVPFLNGTCDSQDSKFKTWTRVLRTIVLLFLNNYWQLEQKCCQLPFFKIAGMIHQRACLLLWVMMVRWPCLIKVGCYFIDSFHLVCVHEGLWNSATWVFSFSILLKVFWMQHLTNP